MSIAQVAISMEESLLRQVDELVSSHVFPSRSRVIQDAVAEKLRRLDRSRLARECAKLDPAFEQTMPKRESMPR